MRHILTVLIIIGSILGIIFIPLFIGYLIGIIFKSDIDAPWLGGMGTIILLTIISVPLVFMYKGIYNSVSDVKIKLPVITKKQKLKSNNQNGELSVYDNEEVVIKRG